MGDTIENEDKLAQCAVVQIGFDDMDELAERTYKLSKIINGEEGEFAWPDWLWLLLFNHGGGGGPCAPADGRGVFVSQGTGSIFSATFHVWWCDRRQLVDRLEQLARLWADSSLVPEDGYPFWLDLLRIRPTRLIIEAGVVVSGAPPQPLPPSVCRD